MGIGGFFAVFGVLLLAASVVFSVFFLRRQRRKAFLYGGAIFILTAVWYVLPMVDSIASVVFFPHDTVFSARYSEGVFQRVKEGHSMDDVLASLGEPLDRQSSWDGESEIWYYTKHGPRYANYWNKIVVFDVESRRVTKKVDEYYSD